MKKTILTLLVIATSFSINATHVIIIESQTSASWADQDTHWKTSAEALGYTAEILPQSTLDNLSNLSSADLLVVSSGIFTFLSTDHMNTVIDFVVGGRSAYIQSEYLTSFQGNITFQAVMDAVGADFAWTAAVSGQLVPMNVLGELATTPNAVTELTYFNYGYAGQGEDVDPILEYQGNYLGFCYVDPGADHGTVITTSDEDWAWNDASPLLMQNILYKLMLGTSNVASIAKAQQFEIFPNPCLDETTFRFSNDVSQAQIHIINSVGAQVKVINLISGSNFLLNCSELATGTYFIEVINGNDSMERKRLVVLN